MSIHVCKCTHMGNEEFHLRYPGMPEKNAQHIADLINAGALDRPTDEVIEQRLIAKLFAAAGVPVEETTYTPEQVVASILKAERDANTKAHNEFITKYIQTRGDAA